MCGIVGAVSPVPIDGAIVARMRDQLAHRGPDYAGLWHSDDRRICLGHRRLAIIDLSADANQPLVSGDRRLVITFNGEIYNFREIRTELIALGTVLTTNSDTEVLLAAYRQWGESCLERLSGMFAFAIWDTVSRELFCARDRAGEKPFYYATCGDSFIFSSELKALLEWPSLQRRLNYHSLADYLTYGFVPDPETIWEGIHKLPAAHRMTVTMNPQGALQVANATPYWDWVFRPDHTVVDWGPEIRDTLQHASQEMSLADVPVGVFLSGGVDSSAVSASLHHAQRPIQTFSVGFEEAEYDERQWSRQVVALYPGPHTETVVTEKDVAPVTEQLIWHFDEPFNDYSYLPTYYLCRDARRAIAVALSGDGGDELFAGYRKYQRIALSEEVRRFLPRQVGQALALGANSLLPTHSTVRRGLQQHGLSAAEMLTDMLTTGFSYRALCAAARGPLAKAVRDRPPSETVQRLLKHAPPRQIGLVNAMRYLDFKLTLGGDILVKVDRASMAVALEVRPVFLHREMIDLAGRIPAARLADRQHAKRAVKEALRPWLPDAMLYREKMGFALPLKEWMTRDLSAMYERAAASDPLDGLVDEAVMRKAVVDHAAGRGNWTSIIHSLLFLQHWLVRWN
jgi:asparagine synthase (glutamine-hydrolysing)